MPDLVFAAVAMGMNRPLRRNAHELDLPLVDFIAIRVTGSILLRIGTRAHKRGDVHLFNHIVAAAKLGAAGHAPDSDICQIPSDVRLNTHKVDLVLTIEPKDNA